MAIADLLPPSARLTATRYAAVRAATLAALATRSERRLLGRSLAIVYQDPMSSLNPALRVGRQLGEVAEVHEGLSRAQARSAAVDRLRVGPDREPGGARAPVPARVLRRHAPARGDRHGADGRAEADHRRRAHDRPRRDRAAADPRLLRDVSGSSGSAAIFISHDVAVVSQLCSRVLVMYAGRIVEELDVATLVRGPAHPYTAALVASVPTMESDSRSPARRDPRSGAGPVRPVARLPVRAHAARVATDRCRIGAPAARAARAPAQRVACWHPLTRDDLREHGDALVGERAGRARCDRARRTRDHRPLRTRPAPADARSTASSSSCRSEPTVGLVGESGSGKSTLARALVGLVPIAAGEVLLDGEPVPVGRSGRVADPRRRVQMIFQDPFSSLNPRMSVGAAVGEALAVRGGTGRSTRSLEVGALPRARPPRLRSSPPSRRAASPAVSGSGSRSRARSPPGRRC